ncbi:unnamed protein product [Soboliphyme baturini]|uniref:Ras modification protein ERF4 n=1 Tax=Soboliphyme baturini TaxID=241478 RepID=A0A183J3S7_9BILA|nr:unnamed protein product [Soboliphyme baturini]
MQMQIQPVQRMSFSLNNCPKVFVQRDYSNGLTVKFSTKLPPELQDKLDANVFEKTVQQLNAMYAKAEQLTAESVFENVIGCLTCYVTHMCMTFQYEKVPQLVLYFILN